MYFMFYNCIFGDHNSSSVSLLLFTIHNGLAKKTAQKFYFVCFNFSVS